MVMLLALLGTAAGREVIDFEDFGLGTNEVYNGSDRAGGFELGGVVEFGNDFDDSFGFDVWSGFAVSSVSNTVTPGLANQYASFSGGGLGGTGQYAVVFDYEDVDSLRFFQAAQVDGLWVNNTTYAGLVMRDGDPVFGIDPFGGPGGDEPDEFRLTIEGRDAAGTVTGSETVWLADFRGAEDLIVDDWMFVDLTGLGNEVRSLHFGLESTDQFMGFNNTPNYFALDDLTVSLTALDGEVRLAEVLVAGPDGDSIRLVNEGTGTVNVTEWRVLAPNLVRSLDGMLVEGDLVLQPGEEVRLSGFSLPDEVGELGLYASGSFNSGTLRDYLQWGAVGGDQELVGVSSGLWPSNTFLEVAAGSCGFARVGGAWSAAACPPGPCLLPDVTGVVWEDLGLDGSPDNDNLDTLGISGAVVVVRSPGYGVAFTGVTDAAGAFALAVPTQAMGAAAVWCPATDWVLEVDAASLPAEFARFITSPLQAVGNVTGEYFFAVGKAPTAVSLVSVDVRRTDAGVSVAWRTGFEENHLGTFVLWAPDGAAEPVAVHGSLVLGRGAGKGAAYEVLHEGADGAGQYWLEEIESDLDAVRRGPFVAPLRLPPVGGRVVTVVAEDGGVEFVVAPGVDSYLLIGFASAPVVEDLSDPGGPRRVEGETLEIDGGVGVYLSPAPGARIRAR